MRFGAWYSIDDAGELAPDRPGIFQVRLEEGLVDYPGGRSAMVWYGGGASVRALATAYAAAHPDRELLCRHDLSGVADPVATLAKILAEFAARFGAEPSLTGAP